MRHFGYFFTTWTIHENWYVKETVCTQNRHKFDRHQQICLDQLFKNYIFLHILSLFRPKHHRLKYYFCFVLTSKLLEKHLFEGPDYRTLYQFNMRWERKEETRAQHPAGFEPTTSWVSAPKACALPLCYNSFPAQISYMCQRMITMRWKILMTLMVADLHSKRIHLQNADVKVKSSGHGVSKSTDWKKNLF